jgi:hypothetical protein
MKLSLALVADYLETQGIPCSCKGAEDYHLNLDGFRLAPFSLADNDTATVAVVCNADDACAQASYSPGTLIAAVTPGIDTEEQADLISRQSGCERLVVAAIPGGAGALLNACLDVSRRLDDWDERLTDALVDKLPLQQALDIAAEMLDNPFAVFDDSSGLIAYAGCLPEGYENTIWGKVLSEGRAPMSYYSLDERTAWTMGAKDSDEPVIMRPHRTPERTYVSFMMRDRGTLIGSIALVDFSGTVGPGQLGLLKHVRDRIRQSLAARLSARHHKDPLGHCLRLLLSGDDLEDMVLEHHLIQRNWSIEDSYCMSVMPLPAGTDPQSSGSYLEEAKMRMPEGLSIVHEGFVVTVRRLGENHEASIADFSASLKRLLAQGVVCGLSDEFAFPDARNAFRQARIALRESPDDACGVIPFARVFSTHLVRLVIQSEPVTVICHPAAIKASRLDDGDQSLSYLTCYLLHGQNIAQAARALYINRNTFEYRIRRLEEHIGYDLASMGEQEQLRLLFSCQMLLEGTRP